MSTGQNRNTSPQLYSPPNPPTKVFPDPRMPISTTEGTVSFEAYLLGEPSDDAGESSTPSTFMPICLKIM